MHSPRRSVRLANADCAEEFPLAEPIDARPGTVMVLDDRGSVRPSRRAYDPRVVGVVSGAGPLKPAIVLDARAGGGPRAPLALTGKVYCKVDAREAPIRIGDLLTTAEVEGHARRATEPDRAFGAVIGKALEPLDSGCGLILILAGLGWAGAVISLRQVAASCVDVRGGFSVVRDFYGYREERPGALSLRLQLSLLRNPHVHLDVILVGADQMGSAPRRRIDDAIFGAREIFEQIPLGIARVAHHELETADAQGFEILETKAEAKKLTRKFRGSHDDAMDVFFVLEYHHAGGLGNIPGCNKDLYAFNGVVVTTELLQLGSIPAQSGRLLAHELGHALRLTHRDDDGNLMQSGGAGTHLTGQQRNRMLRDCFVQAACWRPDDA